MSENECEGRWDTVAVDHVTRLIEEAGQPVQREYTVFLLRHSTRGEMKFWEAPGHFDVPPPNAATGA